MKTKLLLLVLVLSACAPSEASIQTAVAETQASYTDTPAPTQTPVPTITRTPSPTPNLPLAYFSEYLPFMQEWGEQFQNINSLTQQLADDISLITDVDFVNELAIAMTAWEESAKNAAEIEPPLDELRRFQEMAEELHAHTETYNSLYGVALGGDPTALVLMKNALEDAGEIFTKIADEIEKGNYIP